MNNIISQKNFSEGVFYPYTSYDVCTSILRVVLLLIQLLAADDDILILFIMIFMFCFAYFFGREGKNCLILYCYSHRLAFYHSRVFIKMSAVPSELVVCTICNTDFTGSRE